HVEAASPHCRRTKGRRRRRERPPPPPARRKHSPPRSASEFRTRWRGPFHAAQYQEIVLVLRHHDRGPAALRLAAFPAARASCPQSSSRPVLARRSFRLLLEFPLCRKRLGSVQIPLLRHAHQVAREHV